MSRYKEVNHEKDYLQYNALEKSTSFIQIQKSSLKLLLFILLHFPGAYLLYIFPKLVTLYAIFTIIVGLVFLLGDKNPRRLIFVCSYITGAELLWRILGANIFWETGKYAIGFFLFLAHIKYKREDKTAKWPFFYFALLLPSILVMPYFDREAISFNLAGPLALSISVIFFSERKINIIEYKQLLSILIAPIVSVATLVSLKIVENQDLIFGTGSNFQTSADYGPNQVSSILALGSLAAVYCLLIENKKLNKGIYLVIFLWLLTQSVLTFSRGGFYTTVITMVLSGIFFVKNNRTRLQFIIFSTIVGVIGILIIIPYLESFTQNAFSARYQNLETTGRIEIIQADLNTFQQSPIFGVGPNQSKQNHAITFRYSSAHTEYSRMLAEHGVFGLMALILLLVNSLKRFFMNSPNISKAFLVGMTIWALLFMFHAATRLVAPSFLFGLASSQIITDKING